MTAHQSQHFKPHRILAAYNCSLKASLQCRYQLCPWLLCYAYTSCHCCCQTPLWATHTQVALHCRERPMLVPHTEDRLSNARAVVQQQPLPHKMLLLVNVQLQLAGCSRHSPFSCRLAWGLDSAPWPCAFQQDIRQQITHSMRLLQHLIISPDHAMCNLP